MKQITVSAKIRKDLYDKLREYNVNISEIIRQALENEVRKVEEEKARASAEKIARELKIDPNEVAKLIREDRDNR
ncbi:MAG: type II toxin-antitoxin system CcdA family antitoxin [Saccharolobus sp.]